jgi:hypothetical protein
LFYEVEAAVRAWYKTTISSSDDTEFNIFSNWLGVSD